VVFTKVATPELMLEKPNSSSYLTSQNSSVAGFSRVEHGGSDVWFVRSGTMK
jgi:hypothetical protein